VTSSDSTVHQRRLVLALKRGDERAFEEFVRMHQHQVFGLCLRMLGSAAEAEDVAQEVFLSVFRAIHRFREECRLSTWVYRICRNQCLNRLSFLKRRAGERTQAFEDAHLISTDALEPPKSMSGEVPRPDRIVEGKQLEELLQLQIKNLSEEHREIFILRDLENLSYEEIETITGLPEGTVKSRLHRARMDLMRLMEPYLK
jgi:RNA polymerase sigma-70 factor (ECF subfamily)